MAEDEAKRRLKLPAWIARAWKILTHKNWVLGGLLTLLVVCLDWSGRLVSMDRWFSDQRNKYCQFYTPSPTDRLVHVDIDDNALDEIGHWPWPRSTVAEIVDELRIAGADALTMDVTFGEAQDPTAEMRSDGSFEVIDHDKNLAEAFHNFKRVMLPVSFTFDPKAPPTPRYEAYLKVLRADLELTPEDVSERISAHGRGHVERIDEDEFLRARGEAILEKLQEAQAKGPRPLDELRALLLPNSANRPGEKSLEKQFEKNYWSGRASVEMRRFTLPAPMDESQSPLRLLTGTTELTTTLQFAQASSCSGYSNDFPRPGERAVRAIPLCVSYQGQVYPQMDLAMACAELGVNPRDIQFRAGEIILPRPGGHQTIIPVHDDQTGVHGVVGTFFDIPWFGTSDWKTMYDYPLHRLSKQHIPITLPWALANFRKVMRDNNHNAEAAMLPLVEKGVELDSAKAFLKNPPDFDHMSERVAGIQKVIDEVGPLAEPARSVPFDQLDATSQVILRSLDALKKSLAEIQKSVPVFQRKCAELRAQLDGKAVIIGGTATSFTDSRPTPLHPDCPGVVIHGVIYNSIMTGYFWKAAPQWVTWLITLGAGVLTTMIVTHFPPLKALSTTVVLALAYLTFNSLVLFDRGKWRVDLAGPLIAIILVWGILTLRHQIIESREKARITRRLGSYVDPSLVKHVLDHPELVRLDGQVLEMTVGFTDLAGFTSFAEKMKEKAVGILGRYMGKMLPAIQRHNGFVHRLMGDGIMFSYGAPLANPNKAADAAATVLEMQTLLDQFNEELVAEGYPRLMMRAGINTGMAVVGDSGTDRYSEYACLGDTTNLASRLEGANSAMGTRSLLSGSTVDQLNGRFLVRPIARLRVVGKAEPVMTYEPLAPMESATEQQKQLAALTTAMFEDFIAGRLAECIVAAGRLEEAFGPSKLAVLYRDHCERYLKEPPVDFGGVIVLREK